MFKPNLSRLPADVPPAVVFPAYAVNSYAVVRSLGPYGIPIIALDSKPSPVFRSRWVIPFICPDPHEDTKAFVDCLVNLGSRLPCKGVLFMMNDLYAYIAARNRTALRPYYYYSYLDEQIMDDCLDKYRMTQVCVRAGVPVPKTAFPLDEGEADKAAEECGFPCIVKPRVARFSYEDGKVTNICAFPNRFGGKAVRVTSLSELRDIIRETDEMGISVCVQEEIEGPATHLYTVNLYANDDSRVVAAFCGYKLRQWPADFGTVTLGQSKLVPELVELSQAFISAVGYRGLAGLEFKYDEKDGIFKFLEINPRDGQWVALATAAGVNLPLIAYREFLGNRVQEMVTQKLETVKWVDLRDDIGMYYLRYRRDARYSISFWEWLVSLRGRKVEAVLNVADPVPGIERLANFCWHGVVRGMKRLLRRTQETGDDLR